MIDIYKIARKAGYGDPMKSLHLPALERFAALYREAVVQELVAGSGEPVATLTVRDDMGADIKLHQALTLLPGQTFALYTHPAPVNQQLLEALHKLADACNDSDGCQYGTLSTAFVRDIARAAIAAAEGKV